MIKSCEENILATLEDRRSQIANAVTGGGMQDYAAYKFSAGQINGIDTAKREIIELLTRMQHDESGKYDE